MFWTWADFGGGGQEETILLACCIAAAAVVIVFVVRRFRWRRRRRRSNHRMIEPIIFRQRGRRARSPARHPNARLPASGARTPIVNQTGRLHMIAFFDLAAYPFQKTVPLDGGRPVEKFDDVMIWIKASLELQERRLTPPLWRDQLSPKFQIMIRKGAPQMCTNTIVKLLIHPSSSYPFAPR